MGEIAEMILDGILDEQTGEYIGEGVGYPRTRVKGQYNTIKHTRSPSERKIASIRKEIAILVKEQGVTIEKARQMMNEKYGKGWRERGLVSNSDDQWSKEDLKNI